MYTFSFWTSLCVDIGSCYVMWVVKAHDRTPNVDATPNKHTYTQSNIINRFVRCSLIRYICIPAICIHKRLRLSSMGTYIIRILFSATLTSYISYSGHRPSSLKHSLRLSLFWIGLWGLYISIWSCVHTAIFKESVYVYELWSLWWYIVGKHVKL